MGDAAFQERRADQLPDGTAGQQVGLRVRRLRFGGRARIRQKLDQREDIKLFVKLPDWFKIDTPVGKYNPDWAIVKHEDETLYLVRETKGTKDFLKLRTARPTRSVAVRSTSKRSACRLPW